MPDQPAMKMRISAVKWAFRPLVILATVFVSALATAQGIGFDAARHLLYRTGFAASWSDVQDFAGLTREQAAHRLLDATRLSAVTPPPGWMNEPITPPRIIKAMSEEARKENRQETIRKGLELRAWWITEMLATPSPLTEKMTLFWHNHFVSSQQKVKFNQLMYRQNVLLRRHALGSFATLLHEVARDPAMVIYLDSASNRQGQPNENFAREAMELFTLGEGHYAEQDVKEAARAFTGWSLDRDSGQYVFRRGLHDYAVKSVLGKSGRLDGDDVLDILLAQPATAEFIVAKLWREFISPTPSDAEVKRLARLFRAEGYQIKPLLFALFTSDAFYAAENRAVLVKSPVELLVGTLKQFNIDADDLRPIAVASAALGQNLFSPPNVKGWPGGDAWINSSSLLGRKQFLERLFRDNGDFFTTAAPAPGEGRNHRMMIRAAPGFNAMHFDAERWFASQPVAREASIRLLLASAPEQTSAAALNDSAWIRALVLDPVYQLK